ncbi:winged helix-turn-helix domain-containing protein [Lichenifustis flavocetrariae]|uniref:Winged helix DNA-binding domain-containing protein n=1 Tax=Lichenifustis flavocetrariae TaxID=2949735 RepID=A0AA41YQG7_9HYPH|nr:crosslink repair DNA glycosylase YcaQ family protein [Lichenifustis flavocetrariae]MCW6506666.1 winged helix DNA-binding domain-containing protein [Lichenifustis flavocetrariae]
MAETLSLPVARRVALAAQGLADPRPTGVMNWGTLGRAIGRLNLLQIDSVNVLTRAHYMPLFSRLGSYPRSTLEAAAWGRPQRLFEYWAHEASLLPLDMQPLLRWRMARADRGIGVWSGLKAFATERRPEAEAVLQRITEMGPLTAAELGGARGLGGWWGWSDSKAALEWLFWSGRITTRTRRGTFERVYDLTERVLPASILDRPTPEEAEAHRALLALSAKALGVATANDLRDYFRLSPDDAKPRLDELVEAGDLIPVRVQGWEQQAYLHRDARQPRRALARALLAPFDPLIWARDRTERLFGLRYRIEIYTPADKRLHGYYVLPFLLGDKLAARVDLKADRHASALLVQNAHAEPHPPADLCEHLAAELTLMAAWLGLDRVIVGSGGDLASALGQVLPHRGAAPIDENVPAVPLSE